VQQFIFQLLLRDEQQRLPYIPAYVFRGVVMNFLGTVDDRFVAELHQPNKIRPYAIAIQRMPPFLNFHLVCLKEEISKAIIQRLMSAENIPLSVNGWEFLIVRINIENIPMTNFMRDPQKVVKFQIRFVTPTYFNIRDRNFDIRFPEPNFLFSNLAKIWNQYTSSECQVDANEFYNWVSKQVFVSSYAIRTRSVNIGKPQPKVGCVGWANYLINDPESPYAHWIDILLKFAAYVNVGGNRTAGCGVINYNPLETNDKQIDSPSQ